MLAFQRTFRLARARVTKTLFVLTVVWLSLSLIYSLIYLVIFSLFTYTTEPKQERVVGGFICLPEIAQLQEAASHRSTRTDADAILSHSQLDPPAPASSIVPIIVDGHYPRATLRALSPYSASRPGGLRRRLTTQSQRIRLRMKMTLILSRRPV
jgi:hypothetical protein